MRGGWGVCVCRCGGSAVRCDEARGRPSACPCGKRLQAVRCLVSKGSAISGVQSTTHIVDELAFGLGHGGKNLYPLVRRHEPALSRCVSLASSQTVSRHTQQRSSRPAQRTFRYAWQRPRGRLNTQRCGPVCVCQD